LRIALSSPADWSLFLSQGWTKRISYELELNIGMNHNGISIHHLNSLIQSLRKIPAEYRPTGIFSSLWSQKQLSLWDEIRKKLSSLLPGTQFHFASDSEIWNQKEFGLHERGDAIRPGLTLFGIPPWKSAPLRGILPALTLKSQIVAVHRLRPGEWVGAGGRFRVTGSDPINAAVLAIGFGDGLMRRLENRGYGWLNGKETRFLGPIGIDYCSVRGGASTRVGEEVELFGSKVDPWAQAEAAETIPEEILTSLASRVKRKYDTSFSSKSTS
jgi:alanine racemase